MRTFFTGPLRVAVVVCFILAWSLFVSAPGTSHAVPSVSDLSISDAVADQLRLDHVFFTDRIDIVTRDGVVTLSGRVDNLLARERAVRIAEQVKGVRAVVDTIEVVPPVLRSDSDIKKDVESALRQDPATDSYEVQVDVADNVVTLSGRVNSWQERTLSGNVAKGVKGVRDVRNTIDVLYEINRSDYEIRQDVEQALRWDVLVDHALIDVGVENGMVTLSGIVGSLAERGRAAADAYVANVQGVDVEKLDVRLWARNDDLKGDKYKNLSDKAIQNAVADALLYDPRVASFKVTPEVTSGLVTLRGTVDNLKAKRAAGRTARHTVGVIQVANRLKVRPETSPRDDVLEDLIERAFSRDPVVDALDITPDVQNGVVDLYGTVDNYFEKAQAEDLAARINGIVAVRNYITVSGVYDPYPYNPYLDDWYAEDLWDVYIPAMTLKADRTIKEDIENEFFWSPFVDGEDIEVSVMDGKATLTGTVDSWREFNSASENAFEGGAVVVYNQLTVL